MTTEELEQIGRVVEAKLAAERELTKKIIHEAVEAAKKEILEGIEKGAEDNAEFFHKTWEKMDETNARVTIIEDHVGLADPRKN
jgi:isopropylmalate/homocitrate/citramalate synthase